MLSALTRVDSFSTSWCRERCTPRSSWRSVIISPRKLSISCCSAAVRITPLFCSSSLSLRILASVSSILAQQLLLLGAVLVLGFLLHRAHHLERPVDQAAPAQADQPLAAGEIVERVDREVAVVGDRDHDLLTEQILPAHPGGVREQVGIGDHDQIERLLRLLEVLGLAGHAGRRAVRVRALDRADDPRREHERLAARRKLRRSAWPGRAWCGSGRR